MILNLTEMDIPGTVVPEGPDALVLMDALDSEHLDEVVSLILGMEPHEVVVDIDEEFFEELREELDEINLVLGRRDYDE